MRLVFALDLSRIATDESRTRQNGSVASLIESGAVVKPCFCGPCFGAGDVPCNNGFSIRHTTRNFERREGSKPSDNQIASVALMDARSIAATAVNGGVLTSAFDVDFEENFCRSNMTIKHIRHEFSTDSAKQMRRLNSCTGRTLPIFRQFSR